LEDEIDLRQYVLVLVRYWKWIVGGAVLAAVAAFVVSSLLAPTYEATALVAISRPRYQLQFDARFQNVANVQPVYRAYPELAQSDAVLLALLEQHGNPSLSQQTLGELKQMVTASSGSDPSLLRLAVKGKDAALVTAVANEWADLFVIQSNWLYGGQADEHVAFFSNQLGGVERDLERAQQALIDFQARNRSQILNNQLHTYTQTQAIYLEQIQANQLTRQDVQLLGRQLQNQSSRQGVAQADQLTALLLQIKAFSVGDASSLQLQLGSDMLLDTHTVEQQVALLEGLTAMLDSKAIEIEAHLQTLEPQILTAQREIQQLLVEEERLNHNVQIAQETRLTLSRKLEEARLNTQEVGGEVQLASYAAVPEKPVGPRRLVNAAVAGTIVFLLGTFGALAMAWWREQPTTAIPEANDTPQEASLLPIRSVPIK
jgi:polysaccharide biosynthesis transport protein